MDILKSLLRIIVFILAPFALIFGGAAMAGFGADQEWGWLTWTGLILVAAGLIWAFVLFLMSGPFGWFGD